MQEEKWHSVKVTHFENPTSFYVMRICDEDIFPHIQILINSEAKKGALKVVEKTKVNSLFLIRHPETRVWSRCQKLSTTDLVLIDSGETVQVVGSEAKCRPIKEDEILAKFPPYATHVQLDRITAQKSWSDAELREIKSILALSPKLSARFKYFEKTPVPIVLALDDIKDINGNGGTDLAEVLVFYLLATPKKVYYIDSLVALRFHGKKSNKNSPKKFSKKNSEQTIPKCQKLLRLNSYACTCDTKKGLLY
jgi:hypothetical protein